MYIIYIYVCEYESIQLFPYYILDYLYAPIYGYSKLTRNHSTAVYF